MPNGIVTGHAYTVLDVKETTTGEKLVKCRNPWAKNEWSGKWHRNDEIWTPELRKELDY